MLDFKHMTSTSGADNGLLPRSPSRQLDRASCPCICLGPQHGPSESLQSQPVPPGTCRPHAQARQGHCAWGWLKGTHMGIAPSLSVALSHPPQCKTGAGNITGPGMYMINISMLLCLSPSLSPTLLLFYTALLWPQIWAGLSAPS